MNVEVDRLQRHLDSAYETIDKLKARDEKAVKLVKELTAQSFEFDRGWIKLLADEFLKESR